MEALSREESRLESPPWHMEALRETAARHDAGKEQPVDWEAAKRELQAR
jgi:putative addiction module component